MSTITIYNSRPSMGQDKTMEVPCGRCILCLKRRQKSWAFRLKEETKVSTSACFITLTYENCPISDNGLPTLLKTDYQKFIKRIRKQLGKSNIKYYACGEYGTQTHRPHYHAIMFNLPQVWLKDSSLMHITWSHGHIDISPCNIATISYVTKYLIKGRNEQKNYIDYTTGEICVDDRLPEFALMSKKMGLLHLTPEMINYYISNMISCVTLPGGILTPLPRYFRDKVFSKSQKKILNKEAQEIRDMNFEKLFNNSHYSEHIWKKDLVRKQEKQKQLERLKL